MKRKVEKFGEKFRDMEKTPCDKCGNPVYAWKIFDDKEYLCKECRYLEKEIKKEKRKPLRTLESERRLEIACEFLEKKGILQDYDKSIKLLKKHLYRPGYFQSSNEILVGLELLRKGYKIQHQVKMASWRVDFVIPALKVVLEVDGTLYHTKATKEREQFRDGVIIASLGPEWELVRIREDTLRQNIKKLIPAIKRIKTQRSKVRKSYDVLPDWYSNTHK